MSIRVNIENILQSKDEIFKEILFKITSNVIKDVKSEIKRKPPTKDVVLFDAIVLILQNIKNEEGYVSRLLYRLFGFEFKENVRRKQLMVLGGELKSQHTNIQKSLFKVKVYLRNISSTILILKKLKKAFKDKILFLTDRKLVEKANFYMSRTEAKIKELNGYSRELDERVAILESLERDYKGLLRKIPRYHELNSGADILLESSHSKDKS
jgi:hypothetical protein